LNDHVLPKSCPPLISVFYQNTYSNNRNNSKYENLQCDHKIILDVNLIL
jgi:hypothetical protein